MIESIIVGILSLSGTVIGSIAGILASNKLTAFRLDRLEKKVELHNQIAERMIIAEQNIKNIYADIDELKGEL